MESTETLADLRAASKFTLAQILELAAKVDPDFPKTHNALLLIEERGTLDYWKIKALASVYGRDEADVARIAKAQKESNKMLHKTLQSM